MLTQRCQVAFEIEAQEGTAETLEGADVIEAFNPKFKPNIEPHKRNPARSDLSPRPSVFGLRSATLGFDVELVGPGAAGDAIHISDILKCCGIAETLVASTSATYAPATDSVPSGTLAMYIDGKIYKGWGARGKPRLVLEAGKPGILSVEFTCADFSEADGALLSSGVSLEDTIAPTFQGASLTINSYAALVNRLEIDFGVKLALRKDANSDSGHKSAVITDREPTLKLDPENILKATHDFLATWRAGTLVALAATLNGGTGNTIAISAPKVQYQDVSMAEREGISVLEINSLLCGDSGDDEWQIQIT